MTAQARVRRTRAVVLSALAARALLWGAAAGVATIGAIALADLLVGLPREVRQLAAPLAWVAAGIVLTALLWNARRARSLSSVALWIEERVPSLQYALVTAVDPAHADLAPLLEREVDRSRWEPSILPRAVAHAMLPPLVMLAVVGALIVALPRGAIARARAPRAGDLLERPDIGRGSEESRLSPLVARVIPPRYSGLRSTTLEDPHTIEGLVGSRIELEGRGAADGINGTVDRAQIAAVDRDARWQITIAMPGSPAAVRLRDRGFERLIVLDARADSAPVVRMVAPQRDTVLRTPTGRITVRGDARDGLGLASTWLEYIVSSGQGESFRFRSGILAQRAHGGIREAPIEATVSIDSLGLEPGDVVHIRLAARDRNPARDVGTGASETRVIRIARLGEYDSVAVEAAPPPNADSSIISQRMLILLTEALVKREPRLSRDTVVRESRAIGVDQARLRRRVGEIIFSRLTGEEGAEHFHEEEERRGEMTAEELLRAAEEATEHGAGEPLDFAEGESPVVAINRPLLEAYNAMWAAGGELNVGAPRRALPHMYAALRAIERARQAERVYLRGRPAPVVVDVNRARLAGKRDSVFPASRASIGRDSIADHATRFARATVLITQDRQAAIDSLMLVRVELLSVSPGGAAALGELIEALRQQRDIASLVARARWALAGRPTRLDSIRMWGGAW
jgi:hypothetical protein